MAGRRSSASACATPCRQSSATTQTWSRNHEARTDAEGGVVAPHILHGVYRLGGDRHAPRPPRQRGVYLPRVRMGARLPVRVTGTSRSALHVSPPSSRPQKRTHYLADFNFCWTRKYESLRRRYSGVFCIHFFLCHASSSAASLSRISVSSCVVNRDLLTPPAMAAIPWTCMTFFSSVSTASAVPCIPRKCPRHFAISSRRLSTDNPRPSAFHVPLRCPFSRARAKSLRQGSTDRTKTAAARAFSKSASSLHPRSAVEQAFRSVAICGPRCAKSSGASMSHTTELPPRFKAFVTSEGRGRQPARN